MFAKPNNVFFAGCAASVAAAAASVAFGAASVAAGAASVAFGAASVAAGAASVALGAASVAAGAASVAFGAASVAAGAASVALGAASVGALVGAGVPVQPTASASNTMIPMHVNSFAFISRCLLSSSMGRGYPRLWPLTAAPGIPNNADIHTAVCFRCTTSFVTCITP